MREIKFRAWDAKQKYMAYQGTPDLETLQSFIYHFGDKELMQFTGLKDHNGQEVYEGDVYKGKGVDGVVEWITDDACWSLSAPYINFRSIKIIGNIHQNPELL